MLESENPYLCESHVDDMACDKQWNLGYEAGFRCDELVTQKDKCYMAGYEGGKTAKMMETGDFSAQTS